MTPEPRISVVIPAYNYAATLPRAVQSVVSQLQEAAAELIVIDDGSTDNTPEVVEALQAEYPGAFRALRKPNGGSASVRNLGIREAQGDYLIFLDADDEMAPGALALIAQHLAEHPETRMVIGGHIAVYEGGRTRAHLPSELAPSALQRVRDYLLEKTLSLSNGACVMHREVFARADYPEHFRSAEDIPVFCQVLANEPCSVLPAALALIHKHDDSLRHQFHLAKAGGLALVDEVFASQRLGAEYQGLKDAFYVQRCLSLFRSAYLAADTAAAKDYFRLALRRDWRVLLKASYASKALRLWLGVKA